LDRGELAKLENRFVFECAWEVVNKGFLIFWGVFN